MRSGSRSRTRRRLLRSLGGGLAGIAIIALYNFWQSGETSLGLEQVLLILCLLLAGTCFYDLWAERSGQA
ncbi:MAG: hypothetical protein WEA36_03600 [Balneolaceae bacterium]